MSHRGAQARHIKHMIDQIRASDVESLSVVGRLERGQYTFDVDPNVTKSEARRWIEHFLRIRVVKLNSYRLPSDVRGTNQSSQAMRHKRMIMTIPSIGSIPALCQEYKRAEIVRERERERGERERERERERGPSRHNAQSLPCNELAQGWPVCNRPALCSRRCSYL